MVAEIKIRGQHGLFQIDGTHHCISVVATGTLAGITPVQQWTTDGNLYPVQYNGGEAPIFALYLPETESAVGGCYLTARSGNNWTAYFAVNRQYNVSGSVNLANVRWFVLDRPKKFTGTGPLVQLCDDAGNVIFSSKYPPKAPTRTPVAGRKYAGIGGRVDFDLNHDLEFVTTNLWSWQTTRYATGYFSRTGAGVIPGDIIISIQGGLSPNPTGHPDTYLAGVNQRLHAIDVTEYIP
ncbi:MAG: hypothetical protein WCY11_02495 [Novosphingobium sp.]